MMKKSIILLMTCSVIVASVFTACASRREANKTTSNLVDVIQEYGFESVEVTDDKGKTVTDKNGEAVTTEVAVVYTEDKKGVIIAQRLDSDGEPATDKDKKPVTIDSDEASRLNESKKASEEDSKKKNDKENTIQTETGTSSTTKPSSTKETTTERTTATTKKDVPETKNSDTTKYSGDDKVPDTDDSGKEVSFTEEDQEIIASMLEVPGLYEGDYENGDVVPYNIAANAAVWMLIHDGNTSSTYPSSPVVLDLFKFFGQTVVNFKTNCNATKNKYIKYNAANDTFDIDIDNYPAKEQTVVIKKIEDMGNNNYYKVTGEVSGAKRGDKSLTKVVAIIQKNRLDTSLGFSVKAIKWS
jgi:hypothetical protein